MSGQELLDAFEKQLSETCSREKLLRRTSLSELWLYRHKDTGKQLLLRHSKNANDAVYRSLMNLCHPGVQQIYEVISTPQELVTLEEYFDDGITLEKRLNDGPLPKKEAYRYAQELCLAAGALHQSKIIHRDIKPSNIMLTSQGLKLIDFHISRFVRKDADADTLLLGTVGYAPPEQFGLSQTDPTSDIYAIGVVFNKMLAGCFPSVRFASGRGGQIVRRCVQTQAADRYPNTQALFRALQWHL